jgi:DNA (cytosine-5)-methyltransferase 1
VTAYYNEIDPYAAQWLRNLIAAGHIAPGDVDERSIKEVQPDDLKRYDQCHFFAGIGGWSLALRLAGWQDSRPIWTGSCPCQPFSVAGNQQGTDDPRHLWPEFHRLIAERRPSVVFGEQVASAAKWLNIVRGDLEALDYAVGASPIQAASAGADHFRDRYWFVADHDFERPGEEREQRSGELRGAGGDTQDNLGPVADSDDPERRADRAARNLTDRETPGWQENAGDTTERGDCSLVNAPGFGWGEGWTEHEFRSRGFTAAVAGIDDRQYVECPDGKWRRLPPPGVRWLGTRVPARVAKLRAIGNAIDRRPATEFIAAYMETGALSVTGVKS